MGTGSGESVLVICRSVLGTSVTVSDALLLLLTGSNTLEGAATVAVLSKLPVAPLEMVPVAVKVALLPDSRLMVLLMISPLPEPQLGLHDHVTPLIPAGKASFTVAPFAGRGPLLVTVIVKVTD